MHDLLLPAFLVLPLWLLFIACQTQSGGWRRSILSATLFWAAILAAITELLNLFSLINPSYILGSWVGVNLLLMFYLGRISSLRTITKQLQRSAGDLSRTLEENPFLRFCLICLFPLVGLSFLVAIIAPPNNWDSMTYHMARVMYWIQHQSVAHYPTHNLRQLDSPPWSSFAIMHLQILSGGDRFANLIQWLSMAGCLIGISLVAQQLGSGLRGQVLSTVICATIPMGLLQSVTTQNDYLLSFWLVCLSYNVLRLAQNQTDFRTFIEFGLALGLALLTKGTAYIYGLPLVITGIFFGFKHLKLRIFQPIILALSISISLNFSHWIRNYKVFKTPLGISGNATKNTLFTPAAIVSNIIRNTALHLPIPYDPANHLVEKAVYQIHNLLHLDVNDPRTTYPGTIFQIKMMGSSMPIFLNEDSSGNLISLLLLILSTIIYFFDYRKRFKKYSFLPLYGIILATIAILYNILLAWQPWASRLHLPFFVLASAFIGTVLGQYALKLIYGLVLVLTLTSIPYLVFSCYRPVLSSEFFITNTYSIINQPRIGAYFNANPSLQSPYFKAVDTANEIDCDSIGLYLSHEDHWECPFSRIFNVTRPNRDIKFKSIGVANQSAQAFHSNFDFTPCAIFFLGFDTLVQELIVPDKTLGSVTYSKALETDLVDVYTRMNSSSPLKE